MKKYTKIIITFLFLIIASFSYAEMANFTWTPNQNLILMGSQGGQVKQLQQCLADLGNNPDSNIDGIFGKITKAAVVDFQKENNLKVDGIIGNETGPWYEHVCKTSSAELNDIICCSSVNLNSTTSRSYNQFAVRSQCNSFTNDKFSFQREIVSDISCVDEGNTMCGNISTIEALKNITLNSKAIPSGGGMVCVDNVWKIQLETGDECSFSAFVNQDLDISYTNEICDEI